METHSLCWVVMVYEVEMVVVLVGMASVGEWVMMKPGSGIESPSSGLKED